MVSLRSRTQSLGKKMFLVTTPGKALAVVVVGVSNELAAPERLEGGGGAGKE